MGKYVWDSVWPTIEFDSLVDQTTYIVPLEYYILNPLLTIVATMCYWLLVSILTIAYNYYLPMIEAISFIWFSVAGNSCRRALRLQKFVVPWTIVAARYKPKFDSQTIAVTRDIFFSFWKRTQFLSFLIIDHSWIVVYIKYKILL